MKLEERRAFRCGAAPRTRRCRAPCRTAGRTGSERPARAWPSGRAARRRCSARPAHALAAPPARSAAANTANAQRRHRRADFGACRCPADRRGAERQQRRRDAQHQHDAAPRELENAQSRWRCGRTGPPSANADPDFDERVRRSRRHDAEPEACALRGRRPGRAACSSCGRRHFAAAAAVRAPVLPALAAPAAPVHVRRSGTSSGTVAPQNASCGLRTISACNPTTGASPKNECRIRSSTLATDGKSIATSSVSHSARP